MVIFGWDKELECGVDMIDAQHKKFIKMANSFFIKYTCKKDKSSVAEELQFLQDYIMYHFQAEEAFMVECEYPRYLKHQATHKGMVMKVKIMAVELEETGYSQDKLDEFLRFIVSWIKEHILKEDIEFCRCYNQFLEISGKK